MKHYIQDEIKGLWEIGEEDSEHMKIADGYRSYSGNEYTDRFNCVYCGATNTTNGIYEKYLTGTTTCATCGKTQKIIDE